MAIIVKSRDSLLTTSSGYTNYRGILNLVIILLVLSNARAALENIIKYGILVDPLSWVLFLREGSKHWPALLIVLSQGFHILLSLQIEKLLAHLYKKELLNLIIKRYVTLKEGAESINNNNNNCNNNNNNINNGTHISKTNAEEKQLTATTTTTNSNQYKSPIMLLVNFTIAINLIACLSIPPLIVYTNDTHPISTSVSLMLVSIVVLKLISYHMMNFWCRDLNRPLEIQSRTTKSFLRSYLPPAIDFCYLNQKTNDNNQLKENNNNKEVKSNSNGNANGNNNINGDNKKISQITLDSLSEYPKNVTLENMIRYMSFPTLCYELEYAQTERIRKRFLFKRIIELIILSQLDMALIQQWIVPTVSNSVTPFRQMKLSYMLERLLKLAIPNHVIWLIWFYTFFHSLLNIIAELTRFADREFYRDWWNSESVYYFWSNWNIPVHKWCARHLYVPLIALGLTKCQASTAVFFVSAFFHEYLVSVPLKLFRMWAFCGMLIQLPWAKFVSLYFNNHFANVAVWVSLIIGQPLCILMYYHDYYVINNIQKSINITINQSNSLI